MSDKDKDKAREICTKETNDGAFGDWGFRKHCRTGSWRSGMLSCSYEWNFKTEQYDKFWGSHPKCEDLR